MVIKVWSIRQSSVHMKIWQSFHYNSEHKTKTKTSSPILKWWFNPCLGASILGVVLKACQSPHLSKPGHNYYNALSDRYLFEGKY